MLTWDSPSHRGTWADHGMQAVYLGPADKHLRAFEVWVTNTSAPRITNTVWWFLHDHLAADEPLLQPAVSLAYPPTKSRPDPRDNGSDLVGRAFLEPELGVCIITGLGPVVHNQMSRRARLQRDREAGEPLLNVGAHFTLLYKQTRTGEEHYSSLTEILNWIEIGPLLQPPLEPILTNQTEAPVTTPSYVPATLQYVPNPSPFIVAPDVPAIAAKKNRVDGTQQRVSFPKRQRVCRTTPTRNIEAKVPDWTQKRVSLPRQAKTATAHKNSSALAVTPLQSQDGLQPLSRSDRARGFKERLEFNSIDPEGDAPLTMPQASALSLADPPNEMSLRPAGFIPIPYPFIENEPLDKETDRFIKWCEDNELRLKHARQDNLSDNKPSNGPSPPREGNAFNITPPQ